VIKQVLRVADGRRADVAARALIDAVKGIVFFATPHSGSADATWLDRLRIIAWPSASSLDLVRNNANLRDLNIWYKNWSAALPQKVFYEKQGTATGIIVADDSSDPGLPNVEPVGIDADHLTICKPTDPGDLVYVRTRDFFTDQILQNTTAGWTFGLHRTFDLPAPPRSRSNRLAPVAIRIGGVLLIAGVVAGVGVRALLRSSTITTPGVDSVKIQSIGPRPGAVFPANRSAEHST
jgi:hypothetical protein